MTVDAKLNLEHYREFFALSLDLFCIFGFDANLKHSNSAVGQVLQVSDDELKAESWIERVHPEDRRNTMKRIDELTRGDDVVQFTNRIRAGDDSYRWFVWNAKSDLANRLIYAVARDVTDERYTREQLAVATERTNQALELQRQAKEEAERSREHIHRLLSQVPAVAAVVRGPDHIFEFANQSYIELVGGRDLIGLPVREALPGLDVAVLQMLDRAYSLGESTTAYDFPMVADWHGNGKLTQRYFSFIYDPTRDRSGRLNGVWVLGFEVTAAHETQRKLRASERMASLGTLAACVAHEINNPLTYVLGNLARTRTRLITLDPELLEQERQALVAKLDVATAGTQRIAEIVKSLKVFSFIDDRRDVVDLHECLRSTMCLAEARIRHHARVAWDLRPVPRIVANAGLLSQVFLNLLMNAADAISPVGRAGRNCISLSASTSASGDAVVTVSDTGCGIPAKNLDKIFEPFFTSKPVGEGTGLGLAICHGIVASLGGSIEVESKLGVGTSFTVSLPADRSAERPASMPAQSLVEVQPSHACGRGRLLVVDDEQPLAEMIVWILPANWEATVTYSVAEALQVLDRDSGFDVILCDLMMPDQTGMDLHARLRGAGNGLERRIVFMTGGAFTKDAQAFLAAIDNLVLQKPFDAVGLQRVVEKTAQIAPLRHALV